MTPSDALFVALLLAGLVRTAAAAPAPELAATRARLEVRVAGECTSRSDLAARVATRSPRIQFVDDAAISAEVVLTSAQPGNVVAALSLAEPGADATPRATPAPPVAPAAESLTPVPPPPPAKVQAAPAPPMKPRFGASAAGQLVFGAAPSTLPGIALYVMAELDRAGTWSPALFVGASRSWLNDLDQPRGSASFTLDAASIDACPLRWRFWVVVARPCALALVGRMTANGSNTDAPASATRPFAVAGAAFTATFGTMVELSARLAVGVALIQDSYELGGDVFYKAGPFTTTASLAFGKSWP